MSSLPAIASHPKFRELSNEFFKPYPPYVLVNSESDAKEMLNAGCEASYLVVLDAEAPEGSNQLSSANSSKFKSRIGVLAFTLPSNISSLDASHPLDLLSTEGTIIGFAHPDVAEHWKSACIEWANLQKTTDTDGKEADGVKVEWSASNRDGWVEWSIVKKAPEWAFC
ncbi:hypothetical protein RhiJN_25000 [Ceratobasidium sp. AG-Ba]|nr:hypothetical protein RhiJN_25000 [Ceratobasidium sp. AG-Ba]